MSKYWCFTLNNYTEEDCRMLRDTFKCSYIVFGKEVGVNGTPHLQGYFERIPKIKLSTLKNNDNLGKKYHLETRRGSQAEAIAYCKKGNMPKQTWDDLAVKDRGATLTQRTKHPSFGLDANIFEKGVPTTSNQGARTDIQNAIELAKAGGMREVSKHATSYSAILCAKTYLTYNEHPRDFAPHVVWIYGPSGAGKSKLAQEMAKSRPYMKNTNNQWWDGYDAHEDVILDDFRDSWWSITEMLSILDRYERQVQCKGGNRQLLATQMIITSINHPETCYAGCVGEPKQQLLRRISEIIHLETVPRLVPEVRAPVPEVDEFDKLLNTALNSQ